MTARLRPVIIRAPGALDVAAMQRAADHFVGRHDFLSLCAANCEAAKRGSTVRTITRCEVERAGALVSITVTADGYLYNMVRILAGTLLRAGQHKLEPGRCPRCWRPGTGRRRAHAACPGLVF